MKLFFILIIALSFSGAIAQNSFSSFFLDKTLRIDVTHSGDKNEETFFVEQYKMEPFWGGSKTAMVDSSNMGDYLITMSDSSSGKLLYSRGFSSLFNEWRTTAEASTLKRSFYECFTVPYPLKPVIIKIYGRDTKEKFTEIWKLNINPDDYFINKEIPKSCNHFKVHYSGDPAEKVDIVFIPDGYTAAEMDKWRKDATRFAGYLFNSSPYKENKDKFNIWAVEAVSEESGTDSPGTHEYKNTAVNSTFYTLNSDRYLMTYDLKTVHDYAANVPFDQIYIIVNTTTYGGGAIFNFYSCCSADNNYSEFVFIHEFGHAFGALGDEYFDSEVTYQDVYKPGAEPWQPNLTTLVNFDSKWKNMIPKNVPVPTPAEQKYFKTVGVFEGGGYMAKGVYRPYYDCTMKSAIIDGYCPVCKKALNGMIQFYSK